MALHVPPVVTKVELEMAAIPDPGETSQELADRLTAKGYHVVEVREDRVILVTAVEENA